MTDTTDERESTYRCVVGHAITATELDVRTAVVTLDTGAEVRICREHGAPIAVTTRPR